MSDKDDGSYTYKAKDGKTYKKKKGVFTGPNKGLTPDQIKARYAKIAKNANKPLTKQQSSFLKKTFYTQKNFFGASRLYPLVRSKGITIQQVQNWLDKQGIAQVYRRQFRRPRPVQATVLSKPLAQIGIDLMDMSKRGVAGFNWIFSAVDMFSKRVWAYPIPTKTPASTLTALKKLLATLNGKKPTTIRSDNGLEFKNAVWRRFLKDKDITQIFGLPNKPNSNGMVERTNQALKRMINMNERHTDDKNWVNVLPKLVKNLNATINATTRQPADKTEKENEEQRKATKKRIKKNVTRGRTVNDSVLEEGDKVRIRTNNQRSPQQTEGKLKQLWSSRIYTIKKVSKARAGGVGATTYRLEKLDNAKTRFQAQDFKWYREELLKVNDDVDDPVSEEDEQEVSYIRQPLMAIDPKAKTILEKRTKVQMYEVRFKNKRGTRFDLVTRAFLEAEYNKMVKAFDKLHKVRWTRLSVKWDETLGKRGDRVNVRRT